jgi:hypothetical protein
MMRSNNYGNGTSFEDHLSPFAPASDESWETEDQEEEQEDEMWNESSEEELEWESDGLGEYEAAPLGDPGQETLESGETEDRQETEDREETENWQETEWEDESFEDRELDPALVALAERIMSRETVVEELTRRPRWTTCFSSADVTKTEQAYMDNDAAAGAKTVDRCACIVMFNVGLGQLLPLKTKQHPARSASTRRVEMAEVTTKSIEKAMAQVQRRGMATGPNLINFFDRRNRTAGTLKPERLKASVEGAVKAKATKNCWSAFGLSIMDGYHSVILLVDATTTTPKLFWLDQFSTGVNDDVTGALDQRITDKTQAFWEEASTRTTKPFRSKTMVRIWQLRKPK